MVVHLQVDIIVFFQVGNCYLRSTSRATSQRSIVRRVRLGDDTIVLSNGVVVTKAHLLQYTSDIIILSNNAHMVD